MKNKPDKHKLTTLYTNIDNSLLSKIDELKLRISLENPDIICLSEIKPKNGQIPSKEVLELDGYDLQLNPSYHLSTNRGVCIYTKHTLNAIPEINECTTSFDDSVFIVIPGLHQRKLLVGCIYRSGSMDKAVTLDPKLHSMINKMALNRKFTEVMMVGDFNHPTISWQPEPHIRYDHAPGHPDLLFVDCLHDSFLHQHIDQPTRYRINQAPTIDDLILTSNESLIEHINYNCHLGHSDHITINFTLDFSTNRSKPLTNTRRYQYHKTDVQKMKEMLDCDWTSMLSDLNIQDAYQLFLEKYKAAEKECVPATESKSDDKFVKPIWMKYQTVNAIKKKHSAWTSYLTTKHKNQWDQYKTFRNQVAHLTYRDRKEFESKLAAEVKENSKAFWKYAGSSRKLKRAIPKLLKKDGTTAESDKDKAEELNQQFASVFTKEDLVNIPEFENLQIISTLTSITVTEEILLKHLKALRIDKAAGPDDVHPFILKNLADTLVKPLTILFNLSLSEKTLPEIWKKGIITALFKKGARNLASNYRPISLTSIICKLLERIIVDNIIQHLRDNTIYDKRQHGFTKKRNTVTNLLEALNIWTEALSHHLPVDIIYLDLEKAFDKVPHSRLLLQLRRYGISGDLLAWIESFLTNRKQSVKVGTQQSGESCVTSGVPQGSVLGPVLFLIYVSDIAGLVKNFVSLFADDTKMFTYLLEQAEETETHTTLSVQLDINRVAHWSECMQMNFNIEKCHSLHLGSNNTKHQYTIPRQSDTITKEHSCAYTYTFHNLSQVTDEKDLGVTVDEELKFKKHIEDKISTANKMLGLIRHTFKHLDNRSFCMLYKSLVRPHLEYASVIWSPFTKQYQDMIEKVQRRATKMLPDLKELQYHDRLKILQLPTLKYRRLRTDLLLIYKLSHNLIDMDQDTHCKKCSHNTEMLQKTFRSTNRGHEYKYQIHHHQGIRNRFLTARALKYWNSLTPITVNSPSINIFKNNLEKNTSSLPNQYTFY